jgi:hypothetical protein
VEVVLVVLATHRTVLELALAVMVVVVMVA